MAKFLSIPVTNEGNQLVSADNIKIIKQASATTVTVVYGGAASQDVLTITHAPLADDRSEDMRDVIQNAVIDAHKSLWHNVVTNVVPSNVVSGIDIR